MFQQNDIKIITFLGLCSNEVAKTAAFDLSECNAFQYSFLSGKWNKDWSPALSKQSQHAVRGRSFRTEWWMLLIFN